MLGYEPPRPKFWKALVAAALAVFPLSYIFDVAITHRRPGWLYLIVAFGITWLVALQTYAGYGAMLYKNGSPVWWRNISRAALSLLPDRNKLDD